MARRSRKTPEWFLAIPEAKRRCLECGEQLHPDQGVTAILVALGHRHCESCSEEKRKEDHE